MKRLVFLYSLSLLAADPAALVRQVASYDYGQDPSAVRELEDLVLRQGASMEKILLTGLESAKTAAARDVFCRNLAIAGTTASVPKLAAMLRDPATADMARYALEQIPGDQATAVLRDALMRTIPPVQTGIVVSLGRRRDAASVEPIRRLLTAKDGALARAAANALEKIAGAESTVQPAGIDVAALAKELPAASERRQVQILAALADSGNAEARPVLVQASAGSNYGIRAVALAGLAKLGTPAELSLLAGRAANATGNEQAAARVALGDIRSGGFDAAILQAIPSAEPKVKVELIRAVGQRGIVSAQSVLLAAAGDANRAVRVESIRALRETAGSAEVPALLALLLKTANENDRREIERTTANAIRRSAEASVEPLLAAYQATADTGVRISLLNILSSVGNPVALPVIRQALRDSDEELSRAALNALSNWPNAEPMDDLLALTRSGEPARKILALRGYIKLIQNPSSRTPAGTAKLLKTAFAAAARADEKRAVLSIAQRLVCPESLELARAALRDPEVSAEAQLAATTLERGLSFVKQ